ncbi:MAG: hypothetical protein KC613_02975 [Myxococcales bacterium]|nr:hypothetical protein [Myxococcales bacterium]MCB9523342.1 hypothetical protein [Myxococcales bacterium]
MRLAPLPCAVALLALIACDDGGGGTGPTTDDATVDTGLLTDAQVDAGAACEPVDEACNAADDDCDGEVDEDFPTLGQPCTVGEGPCAGSGRVVCSADGAEAVCDGQVRAPVAELCNGIDDDCDGRVDEGIDVARDPNNCGACGRACTYEHGGGRCVDGVCELAACEAGWGDADMLPFNGCECAVQGEEQCNGEDDDCDGEVDEGFGLGEPCVAGVGACAVGGAVICDAGAAACDAVAGEPGEERCNGLDDDCDGTADEGFDGDGDGFPGCGVDCQGPCPEGVDCAALCPIQDCADEDPAISPQAQDVCGDGIDQNCDGRDAPCGRSSSHMTELVIAPAAVVDPCRDFDGDGLEDNAFAALALLSNGLLAQAIQDGSLTLLPSVEGLPIGVADGRFDLSLLRGRPAGLGRIQITPDSFGPNGVPRMLFPNALMVAGQVTAGPGDFQLGLPVPGGLPGELRVSNAVITGSLTLDEDGLGIEMGTVTGVVSEAELARGLAALPPELAPLVMNLLDPDLDLDGDGTLDAYSACLTWRSVPVEVIEAP